MRTKIYQFYIKLSEKDDKSNTSLYAPLFYMTGRSIDWHISLDTMTKHWIITYVNHAVLHATIKVVVDQLK